MSSNQIRDRIKGFERVKAKELIPSDKNWRTHPPEQRAALKGILSEIGFAGAILVRAVDGGKYQIIDGHLRAKTAPNMDIPVLVTDLSAEEADKLLLTYDPISAMALADKGRIDALLASVQFENTALGPLLDRIAGQDGWQGIAEKPELADPPAQIDKAAELRAKWATAPGQAWQIGEHRLVCGDCREKDVVARLWRDGGPIPKLTVTDPPYGVDYDPEWRVKARRRIGVTSVGTVYNDDAFDWTDCFDSDVVYLWHAGIHTAQIAIALEERGYALRNQIIWVKAHFVMGRGDYHWQHEPCWYAVRKGAASKRTVDRTQSTTWEIAGLGLMGGDRTGDDKPTSHSTQKPVELMARAIRNHDFPSVYDPFCGSGTTLLAAHQLGRVGYGIEIDPGYVAVALERLASLGLGPELLR